MSVYDGNGYIAVDHMNYGDYAEDCSPVVFDFCWSDIANNWLEFAGVVAAALLFLLCTIRRILRKKREANNHNSNGAAPTATEETRSRHTADTSAVHHDDYKAEEVNADANTSRNQFDTTPTPTPSKGNHDIETGSKGWTMDSLFGGMVDGNGSGGYSGGGDHGYGGDIGGGGDVGGGGD